MAIPTYIINLKARTDRRAHIEKEFAGRNEVNISILEACEHKIGTIGLWESIKKIITAAAYNNLSYFLFCEDDHQFTNNYNSELLKQCIEESLKRDADILCGGVSWFEDGFPVSDNLFWVKKFSGLQFTVIFKKMYAKILNADFKERDAADYKISKLASNKYFIYPFISTQKEFGYSDVTIQNNGTERVEELFATTENNIRIIKNIEVFYKNLRNNSLAENESIDFETLTIPTYVINLPERTDRRKHIIAQFIGKKEFNVTIVDACKHSIGALGLWESIRKVIKMAVANDDDVIIICEDDHLFTEHYDRDFLLQNILEAHRQGCDVLNGGIGGFNQVIQVDSNRYWIGSFWCTQFIVLYRKFFDVILNEPYDETVTADDKISSITNHKMVLFPFVSIQNDFGYSDVTKSNNIVKGRVSDLFKQSSKRLEVYKQAYETHSNNF